MTCHFKFLFFIFVTIRVISLIKYILHHSRAKHIDIKNHFICDHIENGCFLLEFVDSKNQLTDILQNPYLKKDFLVYATDWVLLYFLPKYQPFSSMGYVETDNKWVKKDYPRKVKSAKPTKISANLIALLLKDSEELKTRIVAVERGLQTLYDAVEKVFHLQQDSNRISVSFVFQWHVLSKKVLPRPTNLSSKSNYSRRSRLFQQRTCYPSLGLLLESLQECGTILLLFKWESN